MLKQKNMNKKYKKLKTQNKGKNEIKFRIF